MALSRYRGTAVQGFSVPERALPGAVENRDVGCFSNTRTTNEDEEDEEDNTNVELDSLVHKLRIKRPEDAKWCCANSTGSNSLLSQCVEQMSYSASNQGAQAPGTQGRTVTLQGQVYYQTPGENHAPPRVLTEPFPIVLVKRHSKIDDEESMDSFIDYQSANAEEHSCIAVYGGMTDTADEIRRALQHFDGTDSSCFPLRRTLAQGKTPAKCMIVSAPCKGDLHVEHDTISRLQLFPGAPSRKVMFAGTETIADDCDLASHAGLKGFNSKVGGKGSLAYLIGFDEDFVTSAQAHIADWAEHKREKRIKWQADNRTRSRLRYQRAKRRKAKSKARSVDPD